MPVLASRFSAQWADQRGASFLKAIGRLRPGVALPAAQSELSAIAARIDAANPRNGTRGIVVRPFQDVLVKNYRPALIALLGAVAAVLLIACANIANLLLARGTARRREMAVRTALGASRAAHRPAAADREPDARRGRRRGRARWSRCGASTRWSASARCRFPRLNTVHIDRSVLLFTVLASLLTGALCGLLPALQLSRSNPGDALKDGDRGGSSGRGARTRNALVVAEVALSLMLLASAGLLIRTLGVLQRVSPGFTTERAITMQLLLPQTRYHERRVDDRVLPPPARRGDAMPAVTAGAVVDDAADDRQRHRHGLRAGRPRGRSERRARRRRSSASAPTTSRRSASSIVRGRGFTERDDERAPAVVVINETMAAKYWPGEDPIGKRVKLSYNNTRPREIVGIAGDVKQTSLTDAVPPQMYTPFVQAPWPFLTAVARTTAAPEAAAGSLRQALAQLDPEQAAGEIRTFDQYLARSIATPRFTAHPARRLRRRWRCCSPASASTA